jgi:hypothetical protein
MMQKFRAVGSAATAGITGMKNDDPKWRELNAYDCDLARSTDDNILTLLFEYNSIRNVDMINADEGSSRCPVGQYVV